MIVLEQPAVEDPGSGQRADTTLEEPASSNLPRPARPRQSAPLPGEDREQGLLVTLEYAFHHSFSVRYSEQGAFSNAR